MHPLQFAVFFLASAAATVMGFLCSSRALPFLRPDAIKSGGKLVPAEELATLFARGFFGFAAVMFVAGVVVLCLYVRKRSRAGSS